MRCLRAGGILFLLLTGNIFAATWYVRPDGGTAVQCTGTTDDAYSGAGSNQPCAFKNPFYLWTNDLPQNKASETPHWKIAGGDTVLIKNGDYRMGFKTPDANGWWNYVGCRGNNHNCYNPPIPAGTDAAPTRIVGEAWQTGCKTKPVLRGVGATSAVLSLKGTNHVDVECIELTDGAQCRLSTFPGEPFGCVNYQSDDAYWGLLTDQDTSYLTLRNLFIHGMASAGILGNIGGNVVAENLHLRGNGNLGWDFDPGGGAPSKGPLTIRNSIVEWSACVERYPVADPVIVGCYDQAGANANGDGIGFVDLVGDITIDRVIVRYNQQDGLDALYVKSGNNLTVTNSQFYANSGQQIKTGGAANTVVRNNLVVGNCARQSMPVAGVTTMDYNILEKGFCRASDMVAMIFKNGTLTRFENNTLVTYHPTAFDIQCTAITDVFNASGRLSTDGSVAPAIPDVTRNSFSTAFPILSMAMFGSVYVYPKVGSRVGKSVGRVGIDQDCNGSPCQYWYNPGSSTLTQASTENPLQASDELRVTYNNASLCNNSTMIFANNLVRGYQRIGSTEIAGSFWFNNLPDASPVQDPATRHNNLYCGVKGFPKGPTEMVLSACPGNFFTAEPPALTSEDQLDTLNLYPLKSGAEIDAGVPIADLSGDFDGSPRPYGVGYDVGAFELSPVSGAPAGLASKTVSNSVVLNWNRVPGAAYYEIQRRLKGQDYSMLDRVDSTLGTLNGARYSLSPQDSDACYEVRAGNSLGTGDWSPEVCVPGQARRRPTLRAF